MNPATHFLAGWLIANVDYLAACGKNSISDRLFKNVQMQGAQKPRNEAYIEVFRLTRLEARCSRWAFFNSLERRDRALITAASVIPDADGLGILAHAVTNAHDGWAFYAKYHHVLAHNVFFGLALTAGVYAFSRKKGLAALLAFVGFHIHLLFDLISGRGPDGGTIWSIAYLYPLVPDFRLSWSGQWELDAWPNFVVTVVFLAATFYLAWRRGFSPVSIFSEGADRAVVASLRSRFPR